MSKSNDVSGSALPNRRRALRTGLTGALGLGALSAAAQPAQAFGGRFGLFRCRREPVQVEYCPAPAPAPTTGICPAGQVGTGVVNGRTIYYYYGLKYASSSPPCSPIYPPTTYGMSFPNTVDTGCASSQCQPPYHTFDAVEAPSAATGPFGPGQTPINCNEALGSARHRMHHDLYAGGIGGLGTGKPVFANHANAVIVGTYDFKIPSKTGPKIFVRGCLWGPSDTSPDTFPIFGVGLEWKGPCNDDGVDLTSSGPRARFGNNYYVVKFNGFFYHVITQTPVQ